MNNFSKFITDCTVSLLKRIFIPVIAEVLLFCSIIGLGIFWLEFFPDYWGSLTTLSLVVLMIIYVKFYPNKYT